jgi:hypothetical protein
MRLLNFGRIYVSITFLFKALQKDYESELAKRALSKPQINFPQH